MAIVVVERSFTHPLRQDEVDHMFSNLQPCLRQYEVRWVHSYLSHNRSRMFCVFEAMDAESVRMAHRNAGLTHEAVWRADRLSGSPVE